MSFDKICDLTAGVYFTVILILRNIYERLCVLTPSVLEPLFGGQIYLKLVCGGILGL